MNIAIHALWILIPVLFFLMALWSLLEGRHRNVKRTDSADLFRQGIFLSLAAGVAFVIDYTLLESIVDGVFMAVIPLGLARVLLLPAVLVVVAAIYGPSKQIRISNAPNLDRRRGRSR
jgi:hypothetical protein